MDKAILIIVTACIITRFLLHDQATIHAENGCVEMCDFPMAALMFLTGHWMRARTLACAEIAHFPTAASCFPGPDDALH